MSVKRILCAVGVLLMVFSASFTSAATKVGRFAYMLEGGVNGETQIAVYTMDGAGRLRRIQTVLDSVGNLFAITVNPSEKFLYVPSGVVGDNSIVGFKIGTEGLLTPLAGSPFTSVAGIYSLAFTPNGKFAYGAAGYSSSQGEIEEFSVDTATGALTSAGMVAAGEGTTTATVSPNGKFVYAPNYYSATVSAYTVNATTGLLTQVSGSPYADGAIIPAGAIVHPSGKFLYIGNQFGSVSAFNINTKTGQLTPISGSPFPGIGTEAGQTLAIDPAGHFLYIGFGVPDNETQPGYLAGYQINQSTGALTAVPGSPYSVGQFGEGVAVDPSGQYLYYGNLAATGFNPVGPPLYTFSLDQTTGALTEQFTYGGDASGGIELAIVSSTVEVTYQPTFAYLTNPASKSISEYAISGSTGALTPLLHSPLTDANGPRASAAIPNGKFFYTANANGTISEYSIGGTGALSKIKGSPITGLSNPVGIALDSLNSLLYEVDQTTSSASAYQINPTSGVLTLASNYTLGGVPQAIATDPNGFFLITENSNTVQIGISNMGIVGSVATGTSPGAIAIDASDQFVYVANSADNTLSAYNLSFASPYLTPISGAPYTTGLSPSAVIGEPYGQYLYVANSGDSTISAYAIDNNTGSLTAIAGTFSTGSAPDSLSVSNDGKYLYAANKNAGSVTVFTINSDGTLTQTGSVNSGSFPSSITTVGSYK
jgi:6-phosphogluconolactonase